MIEKITVSIDNKMDYARKITKEKKMVKMDKFTVTR